MLALEGGDFLRVAIFGGILGFAVFFASYSLLVWRKRNSRSPHPPRPAQKLCFALVILGAGSVMLTWAFREAERREGIAGGNNLFVVYGRRDNTTLRLIANDMVKANDIVAEFVPAARQSQIDVLAFQAAQAQARKEAVGAKPLPIDQTLLQREGLIHARLGEEERILLDLQKAQRDIDKQRADLLTDWIRERGMIEAEIASAETVLAAAERQFKIAQTAAEQASDYLKRQLITLPAFNQRQSAFVDAELQVNRQQVSLASLKTRLKTMEDRYKSSDTGLERQHAEIAQRTHVVAPSIRAYREQLADITSQLTADRTRALVAAGREVEAAGLETDIVAAEANRSIEEMRVRAPFEGHVVFRHPAPELAAIGAPVLALSAGPGFVARIALPQAEIDDLAADQGSVSLTVRDAILPNVITAHFVRAEPLPDQKGRGIALFDCTLPADVVSSLGTTSEPIKVELLWRPNLLQTAGFQLGLTAAGFGILGLALSRSKNAGAGPVRSVDISPLDETPSHDSATGPDLSILAAQFHQELRLGQLEETRIGELEQAIALYGDPALFALARELRFDRSLEAAVGRWAEGKDSSLVERLVAIVEQLFTSPITVEREQKDPESDEPLASQSAGHSRVVSHGALDPVTGLLNRNVFLSIADSEVQRSAKLENPLALLMIKVLQAPDAPNERGVRTAELLALAELCRGLRDRDIASRWSDDRLTVLLRNTDWTGAQVVARRLHIAAEQIRPPHLSRPGLAVQIGVAQILPGETSIYPALTRAEHATNKIEMAADRAAV
ncbi:diguanylate cyclase domain-containing protein [Microvirga sp. P5_D2]